MELDSAQAKDRPCRCQISSSHLSLKLDDETRGFTGQKNQPVEDTIRSDKPSWRGNIRKRKSQGLPHADPLAFWRRTHDREHWIRATTDVVPLDNKGKSIQAKYRSKYGARIEREADFGANVTFEVEISLAW